MATRKKAKSFTIGTGRTVSKNYQSKKFEFAIEVDSNSAADVRDALKLTKAVVNAGLKEKIGTTRAELDRLTGKLFGVTWHEFTKGEAEEEVL